MRADVANEIATIIGRKLKGIELMFVRSKVCVGMVNPYDIINSTNRLFK